MDGRPSLHVEHGVVVDIGAFCYFVVCYSLLPTYYKAIPRHIPSKPLSRLYAFMFGFHVSETSQPNTIQCSALSNR